MTLDPARARAWNRLEIGPIWVARDARPMAVVEAPQQPAPPAVVTVPPAPAPAGTLVARPASTDTRARQIAAMDWSDLRQAVAGCTACTLSSTRKQTVFGVGNQQAKWMLVGEAPGAEEDQRGEPFVGQAGRLLDNMLAATGLSRAGEGAQSVYIANVLKCRPPGNRNPEPAEVALCEPFLLRQVELVNPRVVVVMGRFAAQSLLRTDATIASLRGRVHHIEVGAQRVPVVVTYHPAYLLRNLADKAKSWADLCLARDVYERSGA
jgi:uracil-DNA glycosylase